MTARILVVDDIPANVKLLETRLLAEYFEVLTAGDGESALSVCNHFPVDLVLLDIMMPGMDGFEVCERLKANPATTHIPVVMVTALDGREDRIRGLEAGADDFLTKPVNDLQLMARVRSLLRLKSLDDELRMRARTAQAVAADEIVPPGDPRAAIADGEVLVVDARPNSRDRIARTLEPMAHTVSTGDPQTALFEAADNDYDLVIISTNLAGHDPLRLCAQLRSLDRTRFIPILLSCEPSEDETIRRALELGVNDYILRPVDPNELLARATTQIRRKRYNDRLRAGVRQTMEMAVTDGLTGLHNRHYLDSHLGVLVDRANARGRPLSLCMMDIDRFKAINDTYGHDAGDDILRGFAKRIRAAVRGADLACRYGGEEFVVVMPDTPTEVAVRVAERLREAVGSDPFRVHSDGRRIAVTASFGISTLIGLGDTTENLVKRADEALYEAKKEGRNRVVSAAA